MLPSRLYRNIGIPPPLRSLLLPNPSLPPSLRVQLRLRLGVFSNTALNTYSTASPSNEAKTVTSQALPGKMEPRMSITFTCTVKDCSTRSTHQFTKRSYEKGIVLVECPGCHNRHLIADHLGWFKDSTEEGKLRTVEDLMRARGEKIRRGHLDEAGDVIEYVPE